jgi:glycerol-3-phosphate dehydrogenase (NAD(P)+)
MLHPAKIAVLGAGAMGTTCALLLTRKPEHDVWLWSARPDHHDELRERRENARYLPGVPIPDRVHLTRDPRAAVSDAGLLVFAIPVVHLRQTLSRIADILQRQPAPAVSTAKGIEVGTFSRPSQIITEVLGSRPVCVLSGPGHAEEISRGLPACLVAASEDCELARQVQVRFTGERFRVYTNSDIVGVELAGAVKNIVGIAAGICDGLRMGDNAKSALLARFLVEFVRFGQAHGARPETFYGLAGIGDMITTCISPHGRNHRVGRMIGAGKPLPEIIAGMEQIAEGVFTTRSVHERAMMLGLDMPITAEVYRVLYGGKDPLQAVEELMQRDLIAE